MEERFATEALKHQRWSALVAFMDWCWLLRHVKASTGVVDGSGVHGSCFELFFLGFGIWHRVLCKGLLCGFKCTCVADCGHLVLI